MPRHPNVGFHGAMTLLAPAAPTGGPSAPAEIRDPLLLALRAERVARLRAEKARGSAAICEWRARRMTSTASMYHAEARRLRAAADEHEADAVRHAIVVERLRPRTARAR